MNFIRRMLKPNTLPQLPQLPHLPHLPQLGRWNLNYDPKIVHSKVDQANEDHCGCCDKQQIPKPKEHCTQKISESEEYYIPYFM